MRFFRLLVVTGALTFASVLAGCGDESSPLTTCGNGIVDAHERCDGADCTADCSRRLVSVSGHAIPFHLVPDGRIEGATVSILEHPEMRFVTAADGAFHFDGLEEGSEVTLVMAHPGYMPIQTGTITLGPEGAERVTFQAVIPLIYQAFSRIVQTTPDAAKCQMVTTVTRKGRSVYDVGAHGEAGATVSVEPPLAPQQGPIYFNAQVIPQKGLSETSDDGGVLFLQVDPGEYVWTAHKDGIAFSQVKMKCRAGWLVNASPPWGLQVQ